MNLTAHSSQKHKNDTIAYCHTKSANTQRLKMPLFFGPKAGEDIAVFIVIIIKLLLHYLTEEVQNCPLLFTSRLRHKP